MLYQLLIIIVVLHNGACENALVYQVISVKIGYGACVYASTMYEVGVMVSYKNEVVDSRQLHLYICSKNCRVIKGF